MGISELLTFLVAAAPLSEVRGAIPLALGLHLSPAAAFLWAVAGNCFITLPLYFLLRRASIRLDEKIGVFHRTVAWISDRTRLRHGGRFLDAPTWWLKAIALAFFVAVPLPLTGAWTGVLLAVLFDIPPRYAFPALFFGILAAGLIVLGISMGFIALAF